MEELKDIIARMVDAGESDENIKAVVEAYKAKNAGKIQPQVPGAPVEETTAPDMESKSEDTFSALQNKDKSLFSVLSKFAAQGSTQLGEMLASIPSTLYQIAALPQNLLADALNIPELEATPQKLEEVIGVKNKILDYYQEESDKLQKELDTYKSENYDVIGIVDSFKAGNYKDATMQLAEGIVQSAPVSLSMMIGGGATSIGTLAAGSTIAFMGPELETQKKLDKGRLEQFADAFTISAAETVFSSVNSKALGDIYKNIIFNEGKEAGKEIFKNSIVEAYKGAIRKYGAPVGALGEGVEEVATAITQNLVNEVDPLEGVGDAFIQGVGGGAVYTAPINAIGAKNTIQTNIAQRKVEAAIKDTEYTNILDVFKNGENVDKATLDIINIKNSEKAFSAELSKQLEDGTITNEEAVELKKNFNITNASTAKANLFNLTDQGKSNVVSLLVEKQKLSDRVKAIDDDALSAQDKERIQEINQAIDLTVRQEAVAKTTGFAQKVSEQLDGKTETFEFESTKDLKRALVKEYATKPRLLKQLRTNVLNRKITLEDGSSVNALDYIGGVTYGNKIYINKEVAAKTGQFNVGAHEILHSIVNTKIKSSDLGKVMESFRGELSNEQLAAMDKAFSDRQYRQDEIDSEYLSVFSDLIDKGVIKFEEGTFSKINDWLINNVFRPLGFKKAGFADGKQVYQFMRDYQKSVKQGELTAETVQTIESAPTVGRMRRKFEASQMPREDIDALGADQTKADWDKGGADAAIAELYMEDVFDRLMASKITEERRRLPGFSEEDFISEGVAKLIQHVKNFNPEKNKSLYGWLTSQVENKAKQVLKEGKVTEKTFASQVDETSVADEIDSFDQYDEISFDIDLVDDQGALINPLDFLEKEKVTEYRQTIKDALEGIETLDKVTFKTLEDLVPEITAEVTGIDLKKILNPKANLTTGEVKVMQKFIYDNADKLIKLLPEGAVLEAASEKLIGTGTGVPRKLLQYFYNKNPRITKGAGLSPFEKKANIKKADFLKEFGILEDGTFLNFGGQDQRAQGIFALGRLIGKLMTNTAVRQELEAQQINRNIIVDIGAGRSEFQLSQMPGSIATYQAAHDQVINLNAEALKQNFGFTDQQIDELANTSVGIWIKRNKKEAIWNKEDLIAHYNFVGNFMSFLPPEFIKNRKTFIAASLGYHIRENSYGVDWKKMPSYKVLDGERELSIAEILEDRNITINGKQYDVFSREGRDGLLKINKGQYSQETIDTLKALQELESKAKGGLFAKRHNAAIKIEYSKFDLEETREAASALFDKDQATLAVLQNKAFNLLMQDFIASQSNKLEALKQAKKIYSTSASIANGLKSAVTIGGVIFDPKGNYHFEHAYSALEMNRDIFENLLLGKKVFKTPEAWFIPVDMKNELDATEFKTAARNEFVNEMLRRAEKNHVITPDNSNFNLSIAPTLDTMVENSLNEMVSAKLNIEEKSSISEFQARRLGKNKGRFKFFVPPSADDFMGLMYYLVRKGKQGDADIAFIKENLISPFAKAQRVYEEYKMGTLKAYRKLKKSIRNTPANLKKEAVLGFTNEQALRVYMWNNLGFDVPGVNDSEINAIRKYVNGNAELLEFSKQIQNMLITDFPQPQENWASGSLTIDILEHINEQARKEFFADFISVVDETFGKMNNRGEISGPLANKLRAAFGDNYVEALSDVLYRMKVGRSRQFGRNRLVSQLENYINGSIATIMFFNTRSAILQMVSFVNFINFSDNNPIAAAQAYANIGQLSKDVMELMNSDYLTARRNGLKIDVAADDIAKSAESTTNKAGAAISTILRAGYLPTQFADSFAIAFGGAPFFRNRINTYMKEGLSESEAKEKAYNDWKENAEESQQSSRPDKISQQQASTLGRLILAFGNTPMQYARITKKAALDLLAGRGDFKTNMSKMLYYGMVQNILFTGLQQALFSLWLDDEPDENDEEVEKYVNVIDSAIDGFGRGLGYGGAVAVMVKNVIQEAMDEYGEGGRKNFQDVILEIGTLSPAISSKISRLEQGARTFTWKQELEKVRTEGVSLDNPAFEATGKFVSAVTNIPLDRLIRKMDNLSYPMRHDIQTWQAIALALGWGQWELGLKEVNKKEKNKKEKVGFKKPKIKKPLIK